ncbi:uncharacterized protein [Centruroides vittatus]|uniref:uncharacterized protein n=1 Tax=Centruroides vittatus TaxID=120091 RepID=UPI00350F097B
METSINLAFMLVLFMFAIVFSPINSMDVPNVRPKDPYTELSKAYDIYCVMTCPGKRNVRYCLIENNLQVMIELGRNCAQQIQFCQTSEDCCEFVCDIRQTNGTLYDKFLKCYSSALYTYSLDNPSTYPILEKCLDYADKCEMEEIKGFYHR